MIIKLGDIHGEWDDFIWHLNELELSDCYLLQAGDFGIGFELYTKRHERKMLKRLDHLNAVLKRRNIIMYVIRGNHDNPFYFSSNFTITYSNIKFLQDYTVLTLEDENYLFVGGAISVDRFPNPDLRMFNGKSWAGRKEGFTYWKDEVFVYNESIINGLRNIDYVITHTAPNFCHPIGFKGEEDGWYKHDKTLREEMIKERQSLADMYETLVVNGNKIKKWYYGHFHWANTEVINDTQFILLGINEFKK